MSLAAWIGRHMVRLGQRLTREPTAVDLVTPESFVREFQRRRQACVVITLAQHPSVVGLVPCIHSAGEMHEIGSMVAAVNEGLRTGRYLDI